MLPHRTLVASFNCIGFSFKVLIDDKKCTPAKTYYLVDHQQESIFLASHHAGETLPVDRIYEFCWKAIVSMILRSMRHEVFQVEKFIYPVGSFFYQFQRTDTTSLGRQQGTFMSGGVMHRVKFDNAQCFNADINGLYDFSLAEIVLDNLDRETGMPRTVNYVSHIFVHEIVHAACSFAGYREADGANENFVQIFSLFMFEVMSTIKFERLESVQA